MRSLPSGDHEIPARKRPYGLSDREYAFSLTIATAINSKVAADGSIPGYSAWHWKHGERAMRLLTHYAHWCGVKVERDGRDPEECAARAAEAFDLRWRNEPREQRAEIQAGGHGQVNHEMIGQIADTAMSINFACDRAKADDETRKRMHRLHGEMIAHGCDDPGEIVRTVESAVGGRG